MKRVLRYIKGTSNVALCFGGPNFVVGSYVNSNYAGNLDKRKKSTYWWVCVYTCRRDGELVIQIIDYCSFVYYRSWVHDSYWGLQGNYLDSKAIGRTWEQATEDYCVLWQQKCLAHCKESSLSFQDKAYMCSIPLCSRSSRGRKCRHAKDSHQWKPSRCYDKAN